MILLIIRHKRKRQRYTSGDNEALQPVKYQPKQTIPRVQPQESVKISSNPAYGTNSTKERLDEYEEISKQEEANQQENLDEYVEVNQQENLDEYVEVNQQENLDEYVEVNQQENLDEYVEVNQHGNIDEYVEVTQQTGAEILYDEITLESLQKHDTIDRDSYRISVDDFLAKKDIGNRRDNPNYANDMDEIAREVKKMDLGSSDGKRCQPDTGSYVNDLHTQVQRAQQEQEAENEDEEGYTVYDPKTAAMLRKTAALHNTTAPLHKDQEEDLYQNTSVHASDLASTQRGGAKQEGVERPYTNDLAKAVQEEQLKERDQEVKVQGSKKVHHPYVNNVSQIMQQIAEEEESRSRRSRESHSYVNDIASLLPSS